MKYLLDFKLFENYTETEFDKLVFGLEKSGINCNVKLMSNGEIDVELGMFYPDELADKVLDVVDELGLQHSKINISADSYGDLYNIIKTEEVNGGAETHDSTDYLDDEDFNESKNTKLKSHEIKNIAIRMIVSAIDSRIGEGGAFSEFSEENGEKIKDKIDEICYQLEKKIKN